MAPALLVLASLVAAAPDFTGVVVRWPFPTVERVVLENGLTVLLAPDRSSPLVSVAVMYTVGARNEAAGITGLAHYVEHMNFRATRRFPGTEITESITRIGGRWNGYTWIDQTCYAETVHRDALDRMLDLERDRMADALFDPEDFQRERTSVIAELHSYDDPRSVLYDAVLAASFEIHPYRHNTIGWLTDVESVTRDEAYRFYRRFYHPNNAVLVIVGDFETAAALDKVRERFGSLPRAGESTRIRTVEPPQVGERRVTVRRPGPHARVLAAFRAPALADADFPVMVILDALLAGGKGFRFTRDYPMGDTEPLPRAVAAAGATAHTQWQASRDPYVYTLAADVPEEQGLAAVEQALFRTLEEATVREWTDGEMARALRQVLTGWASDLDDKAGRAHQLAFFEVSGGYAHLLDLPARLGRVTRDDLRRFARERLTRAQATVGWFVPTAVTATSASTAPRETSPAPPPVPAPVGPADTSTAADGPRAEPVDRRLANGLSLSVARLSGSGLVALRGRIEAGSLFDGAVPGLSALATELLSRPVGGAPAAGAPLSWQLHEEPEAASARRWIEFSASCLAADAMDLVQDVARRIQLAVAVANGAAVDPFEWEAVKKAAAHRARTNALVTSSALWQRALLELHGPTSPLGRPAWGEPAAIEAATLESLRAFLRSHVHPRSMRLALAGTLDLEATSNEVSRVLLAIPSAPPPTTNPRLVTAQGPPGWREVRLPQPGKSQDDIRVVVAGDRSQPWDRAATEMLLYLLGATGYAGRLGHALVDPGLVYSVYATLEEEGTPGFVMVRTSSAPRDTPEVLRRIRSHLEQVAAGTFSPAELEEAKTYVRGQRARAREGSVATTRDQLDPRASSGGTAAHAVSLDQLNDTARRLFRRGAPLAIVAGPPAA